MPKKYGPKRLHHITLRLTKANFDFINTQVEAGGFSTRNAYFDDLIAKIRSGEDTVTRQLQDALVATLMQFRKDIRRDLRAIQQTGDTSSAFLHALAKMLIVNVPEPEPGTRRLLVAKAQKKYDTLLVNASKELVHGDRGVEEAADED